jgi:membrane fusion protein, multidrug efflux system
MTDSTVIEAEAKELTLQSTTEPAAGKGLPAEKPRKRRNPFVLGLLAVLVVAGGGYGTWAYVRGLSYEDTDNAFVEGIAVRVSPRVGGQVVKVAVKDNQHVAAGEVLVDLDSRDFRNRLDGTRAALAAAEARLQGAEVGLAATKKTAPAAMDQARSGVTAAGNALETAKVHLSSAKTGLEQTKAHLVVVKAGIEEAKAAMEGVEAESQRAKADLDRYEAFYKTGGITASQLDLFKTTARSTAAAHKASERKVMTLEAQASEAEVAIKTAQEMVNVSQSQVNEAGAGVEVAKARFAQADIAQELVAKAESDRNLAAADVERLKAEVAQAELDLSYTRICAPQAGTVTKKSVEVGDFLRPGQPILGLVADEKWVVANFKESQLQHMKPGQPVRIRVDAYPDTELRGHVDSLQEGTGARFSLLPAENATGNYVKVVQRVPVKIVFDGPLPTDRCLSLGMSVVPEVKVK